MLLIIKKRRRRRRRRRRSLFYVCKLLSRTRLPNASTIVTKEHCPKNQLSMKKKWREKDAIYLFVDWFLFFKVESQLSLYSLYCGESFNGHQTFQEAEPCEWQYQDYKLLHWPAEALDSNHKWALIYGVSGCQHFLKRLDSHTCGFNHVRNKQIVVIQNRTCAEALDPSFAL